MPTYLSVPYEEKEKAKELGARFDWSEKQWYCPDGVDLMLFKKWLPTHLGKWATVGLPKKRKNRKIKRKPKRVYEGPKARAQKIIRAETVVKQNIGDALSVLRGQGYIAGNDYVAPDHDCPTPPWEDCQCEPSLPDEQRAHLMDILHGR